MQENGLLPRDGLAGGIGGLKGKLISLLAQGKGVEESSQASSFLRREGALPVQLPPAATQDAAPSLSLVPPPPPPPPLRPLSAHILRETPLPSLAHRRPPSSPNTSTHAPYELDPDEEDAQSTPSLLPANQSPARRPFLNRCTLPFAPPHKAPPGADTLRRCCCRREA